MNNFSGRITDNNNQPVPYATLSANNNQAITTTDAKGNFKLQSTDSLLNVTVTSVGFVPETAQLKSSAANFISIQPDQKALNEIAVVGYGAKRKATDTISAYPAGGWESFQTYVYKKLKKPVDTTSAAQIMGDVQLEFSVDANGDPYNFSVLKSANEASASKAIEIIKDGPKWITTGRNKKGKVTIQF
jgi:outer membrane biosynthesis protein TonB